jgi:uncharacterized phage protein (TIGR02220 family)
VSRINVDFTAVSDADGRFARLAQLLGLADADHARGKCEHLWMACTTRGETDLPQWLVEKHLGERGPDALVECELARWARGRGDSKSRRLSIAGAKKRCLWREQLVDQSSKGGESRARNASRTAGKFNQGSAGASTSPPTPTPTPTPDQRSEIQRELYPEAHGMGPGGERLDPPDPAEELADVAVGEINRLSGRTFGLRSKETLGLCRGLLRNKRSAEDVLLVIRSKVGWVSDSNMAQHFEPKTLLGPRNFERYLDAARAGPPKVIANTGARVQRFASTRTDDEPDLPSLPIPGVQ